MKRFLIILIAVSLLASCSEEARITSAEDSSVSAYSNTETEITKPENDITIVESEISKEEKEPIQPYLDIIKSPYSELYNNAKNPWDMIVHNGYLYVGGGDFDENISPKKAYRYDIENGEWFEYGNIDDEQIDRFLIFDGELYIPGTDPTESWERGNFYKLEGESLAKYRTIPNGVHCFDMAFLDGKLFASLDVTNGTFPVVVSDNGGFRFSNIDAEAFNSDSTTENRIYNLFTFKNELFALKGTKVYKYSEKGFEYFSDWSENFIRGIGFYTIISSEAEFCGKMFFTTGYLFKTENMEKIQQIDFEKTLVSDLYVFNDELYVLCNEFIEEDHYRIIIRKTANGEDFEKVCEFEYSTIGLSFAFSKDDIFIGMGEISKDLNAPKGDIVRINLKDGDLS